MLRYDGDECKTDSSLLEKPLVSVIIPTFNRRDSLLKTLNGLAEQEYPKEHFEVVIVSDGSTDGTDELLTEFAASASFTCRPFRQENGGPSRARNFGVREARGEVIIFIDDDVEPSPLFVAVHAAHHASDDALAVIGPLSPDPSRHPKEPSWIAWEHAMLEKQYEAFRSGKWQTAGPHHFYSGNASLRREHLLAAGGFDENFPRQEDVELAVRLQRTRGLRFVFDVNAMALHRPLRTFASWLKVPRAYGQLDVVRAQRGDIGWDTVQHGYRCRHRVTRVLADLTLILPFTSAPLRTSLKVLADLSYRFHAEGAAFAFLSALYNVRYLEGAREELGSSAALRRRLRGPTSLPSDRVSPTDSC